MQPCSSNWTRQLCSINAMQLKDKTYIMMCVVDDNNSVYNSSTLTYLVIVWILYVNNVYASLNHWTCSSNRFYLHKIFSIASHSLAENHIEFLHNVLKTDTSKVRSVSNGFAQWLKSQSTLSRRIVCAFVRILIPSGLSLHRSLVSTVVCPSKQFALSFRTAWMSKELYRVHPYAYAYIRIIHTFVIHSIVC